MKHTTMLMRDHVKSRRIERKRVKGAVENLVGERCPCGNSKEKKHCFCRSCFYSLPKDLKDLLYSEYWVSAYEASYEFLVQKGSIKEELPFGGPTDAELGVSGVSGATDLTEGGTRG